MSVSETAKPSAMRDRSIDVARGALMMYIVVVIHGLFWLNIFDETTRGFFLFEMPVIFAISGYAYALYERGVGRAGRPLVWREYLDFLLSRVSRILIPYFAYAAACIGWIMVDRHAGGNAWALGDVVVAWMNPVRRGVGFTLLMLNLHLWFIAPFLVITALLPIVSRVKLRWRWPPVLWLLLLALGVYLIAFLHVNAVQTVFFYLMWTMFGYHLAGTTRTASVWSQVLVLAVALSVLMLLPFDSLNMQANKAPPHWIFAFFTGAWVAGLLLLASRLDKGWVSSWSSHPLLKPFIQYGYSIYLWQGIGYSAAILAGKWLGAPFWAVWIIAVVLSVLLGMLASPVEQMKFRR